MAVSSSPQAQQLRLDMQAAHDVIQLLQVENERLRGVASDSVAEQSARVRELVEQKVALESRVIQLSVDLEQTHSEKTRMDSELQEALNERRRLSSLLQDVRRQVDGRFTKLMGELHAKDEEVHRLEYVVRERERDKDAVLALEKMLSTREENIRALSDTLSKSRIEHAQLASTVQQLRIENESLQQRQRSSPRETMPLHSAEQLAAILPLYRQWATDMEKDLHALEDCIEGILDETTDLVLVVERGAGAAVGASSSISDRQRLAAMRKLERARETAQGGLIAKAAQSSGDMVALSVQAIRHSVDSSQYALSKTRASAKQIEASLLATRKSIERSSPNGLQAAAAVSTAAKDGGAADALLVAQLRAALADKDAKLTDSANVVHAANARISTLEFEKSRAENEVLRKRDEQDRLSQECSARAQELQKLLDDLRVAREELRAEREAHLAQTRESEARQSALQRELTTEHEERNRELRTASLEEIRKRDEEIAHERRRCVALEEKEERMKAILEESKLKRNALKKQRDILQEESAEMRQVIASQNKELQHAQDIIESLTGEVERAHAALEHEVAHHERVHLQAAETSAFKEWRKGHKVVPAMAITPKPTIIASRRSN